MPPTVTVNSDDVHIDQLVELLARISSILLFVAHWSSRANDTRSYIWPWLDGKPVPPGQLEEHSRTHECKKPCCLCPFLDDSDSYKESKIGLVQFFAQAMAGSPITYDSKYVAACAEQRCGYFVVLDDRFGLCTQPGKYYNKRERRTPLWNDPFLFMTDETEEEVKKTGLRQISADLRDDFNVMHRGTRKLLRQQDPDHFVRMEKDLSALIFEGLPAEKFWDIFVQCTRCKFVIPRHYFPYQHPCASRAMDETRKMREEMDVDNPLDRIRRWHAWTKELTRGR